MGSLRRATRFRTVGAWVMQAITCILSAAERTAEREELIDAGEQQRAHAKPWARMPPVR